MSKLNLTIFIVLLIVLAGLFTTYRFFGQEDTWICQDGEWVKHGNPTEVKPETACEQDKTKEAEADSIKISDSASGVSFELPKTWERYYEQINKEESDARRLIFNYLANGQAQGLLFILNIFPGNIHVYSVENQPNNKIIIQTTDNYYTVSHGLDMPFEQGTDDFERYSRMIGEIDGILATIDTGKEIIAQNREIIGNDHNQKWNLNVSYPELAGQGDMAGLNKIIKDIADEKIKDFKKNIAEWDTTGAPEEAYSSYWINYELIYGQDDLLSLEFYGLEYYAGAAHPNGLSYSVNYDLDKDKEIKLGDLFKTSEETYLNKLSSLAKQDLEKQFTKMGADPTTDMFQEGIKPIAFNFKDFNITQDKIVFNFPPYQVGPHGLGSFSVKIDKDELADVLAGQFD